MMVMDVVMLMVRKWILRCKARAVSVRGMLYGPDVPRLRSTVGVCVCGAFKYIGNALKEGPKGIIDLSSTYGRR